MPIHEQNLAVEKVVNALVPLSPDDRVSVIARVGNAYCLHCGYPMPPDGVCHCTNDE